MAQRPTVRNGSDGVPAEQVGALAVAVLGEQVPLRVNGYRYHDGDI
jgi:hypothetical protein